MLPKFITFEKSCFEIRQLIFEAVPIPNTTDFTIQVIRSDDKTSIQGVYVYVDADTVGYSGQELITNNIGETPLIRGLSYAVHTFTLKRTGFVENPITLTLNSSFNGVQTLEMTKEKPTSYSSSEKPLSTPGFGAIQSILLFAIVVFLLRKKN